MKLSEFKKQKQRLKETGQKKKAYKPWNREAAMAMKPDASLGQAQEIIAKAQQLTSRFSSANVTSSFL